MRLVSWLSKEVLSQNKRQNKISVEIMTAVETALRRLRHRCLGKVGDSAPGE